MCLGRQEEARRLIEPAAARASLAILRDVFEQTLALVDGRDADAIRLCDAMLGRFTDPEGRALQACVLARLGEGARALALLEQSVDGGFYGVAALPAHPWFASVRDDPALGQVIRRAAERTEALRGAFADAGGVTLLGMRR